MPGLVGIVTKKPAPRAEAELRTMLAALGHERFYTSGTLIDQRAGSNLLYLPLDKLIQQSGPPPASIRARYYLYRFTTPDERRATGAWWHRDLAGEFYR